MADVHECPPVTKLHRGKLRLRKRVRKWLLEQLLEARGCPAQAAGANTCRSADGMGLECKPGTVCSKGKRRQCWLDEARLQCGAGD
jgi:hypothetical protein